MKIVKVVVLTVALTISAMATIAAVLYRMLLADLRAKYEESQQRDLFC